jgi:hypothetical protein
MSPHFFVLAMAPPLSQKKESVWKRAQRAKKLRTDDDRKVEADQKRARRELLTADDKQKEREKDRLRRQQSREKKLAEQGLKKVVNGATYHELQAVEIHDLLRDENNFVAPLKLPDICRGEEKYQENHLTEQDKRNWYTNRLRESVTFRIGCRHYLDGFLYQVERDAEILPRESMCGEDGATASMDVFCDLANAGHKDTGDASSGVATYTELYPGKAKNVSGSGSVNLYTMLNFSSHLLAAVVFCLAKFEGCVRRKVL